MQTENGNTPTPTSQTSAGSAASSAQVSTTSSSSPSPATSSSSPSSFPDPSLDSFSIIGNVQDVTKLSKDELIAELTLLQKHRIDSAVEKRVQTKKKNERAAKETPFYRMLMARLEGKSKAYIERVLAKAKAEGLLD